MSSSKVFIAQIAEGDVVDSHFLVTSCQLEPFKSKPGQYLVLTLSDKTGEIRAVAWDKAYEFYQMAREDDVVRVFGTVKEYCGNLQFVIESLTVCEEGEYDLSDLVPYVDKDINELKKTLFKHVERISNPFLRQLLNYFFDDTRWMKEFEKAPGGKRIHHGYLGGLLEHTVEVVELCEAVSALFPVINRDLLICGAVLHDIGKIDEYSYARRIDMTDEGRLLGHIIMGERSVTKAIESIPNFPRDLEMSIRHMIISHHGELEWGSPKRPKTIEACVLHHVDNLDAKVNQFAQIILNSSNHDGHWSSYEASLGRCIYIGENDIRSFVIDESIDETAASNEPE